MITFDQPLALLLLPAAFTLGACLRFFSRRQAKLRSVSLSERIVQWTALVLVGLALADPFLQWRTKKVAVAFVWDRSDSVAGPRDGGEGLTASEEEDWRMIQQICLSLPTHIPVALVDFAGVPRLLRPFQTGRFGKDVEERLSSGFSLSGERTDISRALAFVAGLRPRDAELRIILVSDGWETEVPEGIRAGLVQSARLWSVPTANTERPEVIAKELIAPTRVFEKELVRMRLRIWSSRPSHADVRLYANDLLVTERGVSLSEGDNTVDFSDLPVPPGLTVWSAEVIPEPGADTRPQNNRVLTGTQTRSAARVLLLDPEPATLDAAGKVFRAAGFDPVTGGVERLPRRPGDLSSFEAVVLSDFPVEQLEGKVADSLREWVAGAGGLLIVCGGTNAFASGGYVDSQFEEMLPVRSGRPDSLDKSIVAVLVSLDRSGSMQAFVGGRSKMELAARGAAMAMDVLGQGDFFGVHAVDTRVHEILPLATNFDREVARRKILGITSSGGGIYVFTALAEAGRELEAVQARVRHLILFADAADAEEKAAGLEADGTALGGSALDLAATFANRGVSVSVVALGNPDDRDTAFLADLASRGGGKFYLTGNALDLPRIFTAETARIARKDFTEDPFLAEKTSLNSPLLKGIPWEEAPVLYGANLAEPRTGSEVLLTTEQGTPLLVHHRLGIGRVAVFTSDIKPRWAVEWLNWPGFQRLLSQLVRGLMPGETPGWFELYQENVGGSRGGRHVVLRALDPAGWFVNERKVLFQVQSDAKGSFERTGNQLAPGLYGATLPDSDDDLFVVTAIAAESSRPLASFVLGGQPAREYLHAGLNETALRALAEASGGEFCERPAPDTPLPEKLKRSFEPGEGLTTRQYLSAVLLATAMVALLVKLFLRRWMSLG